MATGRSVSLLQHVFLRVQATILGDLVVPLSNKCCHLVPRQSLFSRKLIEIALDAGSIVQLLEELIFCCQESAWDIDQTRDVFLSH